MHTLETPTQRIERLARERGIPIVSKSDVLADEERRRVRRLAHRKAAYAKMMKARAKLDDDYLTRGGRRAVIDERGVRYRSLVEAAKSVGRSFKTLWTAINLGRPCAGRMFRYATEQPVAIERAA